MNDEHYLKSNPQGELALIGGHYCGRLCPPGGGQCQSEVDGWQWDTEGCGLRERWAKAADSGRDGNQGLKRMDMRLKRCWGVAQHNIQYLILLGGLGMASEKSVGGERILTILDKCDIRYSTFIFSLRSTWTVPNVDKKQIEDKIKAKS